MFCENRYTKSMTIRRPLAALRFMDDILYMTLSRTKNNLSSRIREESEVNDLIMHAKAIYPNSLRVLTTGEAQPLEFLELTMGWNMTFPIFRYTDRSARQRFRDGRSFAPRASLVSLVQCMLYRGIQFPSTISLKIQACINLLSEFNDLNYEKTVLLDAIHRLDRKNDENQQVWSSLLRIVFFNFMNHLILL